MFLWKTIIWLFHFFIYFPLASVVTLHKTIILKYSNNLSGCPWFCLFFYCHFSLVCLQNYKTINNLLYSTATKCWQSFTAKARGWKFQLICHPRSLLPSWMCTSYICGVQRVFSCLFRHHNERLPPGLQLFWGSQVQRHSISSLFLQTHRRDHGTWLVWPSLFKYF